MKTSKTKRIGNRKCGLYGLKTSKTKRAADWEEVLVAPPGLKTSKTKSRLLRGPSMDMLKTSKTKRPVARCGDTRGDCLVENKQD